MVDKKSPFFLVFILMISAISLISVIASANVQTLTFSSVENEQRAYQLMKVLRCPECQNQNLLESNSERVQAIISEVSTRVEKGESDYEITEALRLRYGDFISYDPPLSARTFFLWFGPIIGLLLCALISFYFYRPKALKNQKNQKNRNSP